ncbi:MAG: peptide ABC transporter substrate-binding protein [Bacillota bacterium]
MFKKNIALMLVFVLVMTAFVGCSQPAEDPEGEPAENEEPAENGEATDEEETDGEEAKEDESKSDVEQVLHWNLGSDPKTTDPGLNGANDGGYIVNNTHEGLVRVIEGELKPAMAESWELSEDKTTYTFKIREGLTWSNGEPLTAKDFEYSWNRVLADETASEYAWIFGEANIDSFEATEDNELVVNLSTPTPYFLGLMGFYTFFPVYEEAVEAGPDGTWSKDTEMFVSNGPFVLETYDTGDKIELVPNENYWKADEVKLDKIVAYMITDQSTALTAYQNGEIDIVDDVPSSEIPTLIAEDPTLEILPQTAVYYYRFNTDVEPLDKIKVRRALTLAVDRKAIVEQVTKGGQQPAHSLIPSSILDSQGNVFNEKSGDYGIKDTAQVEKAQELLAEAGYPEGEGFPEMEILYNTSDDHKAVAEAIQEMWKQNLGIETSLTNQEWAVFQDTTKNGDYEIARGGWIGDYLDPLTFLGLLKSDAVYNVANWENEKYDELIEKSATLQGEERDEVLYQADELTMEEVPFMPVYYYTDPELIKSYVNDWDKSYKSTYYFGNTYISEK